MRKVLGATNHKHLVVFLDHVEKLYCISIMFVWITWLYIYIFVYLVLCTVTYWKCDRYVCHRFLTADDSDVSLEP